MSKFLSRNFISENYIQNDLIFRWRLCLILEKVVTNQGIFFKIMIWIWMIHDKDLSFELELLF